jgi:hypothetical protein
MTVGRYGTLFAPLRDDDAGDAEEEPEAERLAQHRRLIDTRAPITMPSGGRSTISGASHMPLTSDRHGTLFEPLNDIESEGASMEGSQEEGPDDGGATDDDADQE